MLIQHAKCNLKLKDPRTFSGKMCFGAFGGKLRKMVDARSSRQLLHSCGSGMNRYFTEVEHYEKENS